jgi:HD-GYP domain-containing protein (c-di-GMP phosphodiesterase class II)
LLYLLARPERDVLFGSHAFHFWVVSATAIAAALACALIIGLTESLRETRLLLLGLAFLSIAAIFAVHGLATPGHILDRPHAEIGLSSWLSVLTGAAFIAASAATLPAALMRALRHWSGAALAVATLLLGVFVGLSLASPDWLAWVPYGERGVQRAVTSLTLTLLAFAAWRYFQAYRFARLPSQAAMCLALVLIMEVQLSLTFGRYWRLSWWVYHATYGMAFLVLFGGWVLEAWRAGSVRAIANALSLRDAVAALNHGYPQPLVDLVESIERKDLYTLGHVRRVADYALLAGRELRLGAAELRQLGLAAQMHDIGKLTTPDSILKKPARLTPEEYAVIKEHVHNGFEIAMKVPALRPVADAIRSHHERFDGQGYPIGLAGDSVPLLARIVSVADAFDAMTSGRSYQAAVSAEEALAELRANAGGQFDPACVEAFSRALARASLDDVTPGVAAARIAA